LPGTGGGCAVASRSRQCETWLAWRGRGCCCSPRTRSPFHDLQQDYLLLHADDLPVLHADLLAAYQQLLPDKADGWWQLPADEPYIWDHLTHHLRGAGNRAGLLDTVTDPAYLLGRIAQGGPWAAERDLAHAAATAPGDERIDWRRGWTARHAHLLTGPATASDLGGH
jgi:hypothetical protein